MITIKVPSQAARNFLGTMGSLFAGDHGDSHAGGMLLVASWDLMEHARIEGMRNSLREGEIVQGPLPSAIGALD